jgi:hypothetical protein
MDQARPVGSAFLLHVRTHSLVSQVGLHTASGKRVHRGGTVRPHRRTHADRLQVRKSLRLRHGALQSGGIVANGDDIDLIGVMIALFLLIGCGMLGVKLLILFYHALFS